MKQETYCKPEFLDQTINMLSKLTGFDRIDYVQTLYDINLPIHCVIHWYRK